MVRVTPTFIFISILANLFIGCANQPRIQSPAQNFLTSETQGKLLKGSIAVSHAPGASLDLNANENSTELESSVNEVNTQFSSTLQLGLFDRVDFFSRVQFFSPIIYGLKAQFIGRPKSEAEYKGNSFSLFMGLGRKKYYDQTGNNISQSESGNYTFNRSHNVSEFGFVFGHRLYSDILVYARYTQVNQSVIGDIKFEDNENLDNQRVEFEGKHTHYTFGTFWYTKDINLGLELDFGSYNYQEDSLELISYGLILGKDL